MIDCHEYDYIEIACMYRLPVLLTFKNGSTLEGVAIDAGVNDEKQECLKLIQDENEIEAILDDLQSMQATIVNPHFSIVSFNQEENTSCHTS